MKKKKKDFMQEFLSQNPDESFSFETSLELLKNIETIATSQVQINPNLAK